MQQLIITPKRRKKYLAKRNLNAWVGIFLRRDTAATPIPLDLIVDRYLEDTKAVLLREDLEAMATLRKEIAGAMQRAWDIETDDEGMVHQAQLNEWLFKGGKNYFTIPSATVLNMESGFIHKDLCSAGTLTAGSACAFSCTYCSVGATMFRSPDTAILRLLNIKHEDAVIRRLNPAKILREQLTNVLPPA
jgi:hypothetical protein